MAVAATFAGFDAASFSPPITGYEEDALIELVFQKTLVLNRPTPLDLGMGTERLLLAVSIEGRATDEATAVRSRADVRSDALDRSQEWCRCSCQLGVLRCDRNSPGFRNRTDLDPTQ